MWGVTIINVREGSQSPAIWKHLSTAVLLVHGAERLPVLVWPTTLASLTLPATCHLTTQPCQRCSREWAQWPKVDTVIPRASPHLVRSEWGLSVAWQSQDLRPLRLSHLKAACHSQLTPMSISSPSRGCAGVLNVCWCNLPSLLSNLLSINPICPGRWQILKCTLLRNKSKSETQ